MSLEGSAVQSNPWKGCQVRNINLEIVTLKLFELASNRIWILVISSYESVMSVTSIMYYVKLVILGRGWQTLITPKPLAWIGLTRHLFSWFNFVGSGLILTKLDIIRLSIGFPCKKFHKTQPMRHLHISNCFPCHHWYNRIKLSFE